MATHSYKNHEIEVFTRDNGDFIEASAKFKPMHGYLGTFSTWGKILDRQNSGADGFRKQGGSSITAAD